MIVEAFNNCKINGVEGAQKYPLKSINFIKNHGKSLLESHLLNGYAFMSMRASQGKKFIN